MKSNNGIISAEEIQERTKFWNKKQFRTWSKKELERDSKFMQSLLNALKDFDKYDIHMIRRERRRDISKLSSRTPKYIIWKASAEDIRFAIEIAPKTFKVKQG